MKALEFLGQRKITINEEVNAAKTRLGDAETWALLSGADQVTVAKGKKILDLVPHEDGRETILAHSMGPSGNLRAPTLKIGPRFIVGFNEQMYEEVFR